LQLTLTRPFSAARLRLLECGRWSVLLCLFSIPVNKPATSIAIFFALLFSLLGPDVRARFAAACRQPVVLGCAAWFAVLALNALHGSGGAEQWGNLGSYKALLYPLIVASLLTTPEWRNRGLFAFGLAVTLVLLASWAQLFGLLPPPDKTSTYEVFRYTVFKDYTQQGLQFLMLAAMAAAFANVQPRPRVRIGLWFLAAAAFVNVSLLLQSRTAYLSIACLIVYWCWRLYSARVRSLRTLLLGLLLLTVLVAGAGLTPRVQQRIEAAVSDITQYEDKHTPTSLGIRLELWRRTLHMSAAAPWFGHGLGEWPREYARETRDVPDFEPFRMGHPHHETLLILAETGLIGLGIFLVLLILLARHMRGLPQPQRDFFLCLLLIYVSAGLANCLMLDFVHRHGFLMLLACIPVLPLRAAQVSGAAP
jgi:O-antigen ligase